MLDPLTHRDRKRPLRHAFAWLPSGLALSIALALLGLALELAAGQRAVGTATAEEWALLFWEATTRLPFQAGPAALAGPLAALLLFRLSGDPLQRWIALGLATGLAVTAVILEPWSRGAIVLRPELAIDSLAPLTLVCLGLVLVASSVIRGALRLIGPLEDAALLARPLLGGGATAAWLMLLAASVAVPPLTSLPPSREVVSLVEDLYPLAVQAGGLQREVAPILYEHTPGERRQAVEVGSPTSLSFQVPPYTTHLLADFAVDGSVRRMIEEGSSLTVRCDVIVDGEPSAREEMLVTSLEQLSSEGYEEGRWHRVGGPRGVAVRGGERVDVRLEVVEPSDPENVHGLDEVRIGLAPLAMVRRTGRRFARPSPGAPTLVLVRLPGGAESPEGWVELPLLSPLGDRQAARLANGLVEEGTSTVAVRKAAFGPTDGFELQVDSVEGLRRWLESHAGVRSLIWIDLEDPELTNRALDLLKPALDARAGSVVWALVAHDDSRALVLDPRMRQGSEPPARMGETFALELEARAVGAAHSLGEVWEKGL